ncbi:MAG: AIR synthase related protein [Clostridium sp.]|nr:AIR synthase related protein [Clostridium sp.]
MKVGKLSESILKRSVLGQIKCRREEVIKGAGGDCAFLVLGRESGARGRGAAASMERSLAVASMAAGLETISPESSLIAVSMETVTLPVKNASYLAVMAAANNLAASGARPITATLSLTLPPETEEARLREMMREAERCCEEWDIQIIGGHTEISPAVKSPIVTASVTGMSSVMGTSLIAGALPAAGMSAKAEALSAAGTSAKAEALSAAGISPMVGASSATETSTGTTAATGTVKADAKAHSLSEDELKSKSSSMDIVMSKWIGMEGTSILAEEKRAELLKRYPASLILAAEEQGTHLSVAREAAAALEAGVYAMHDVRNGGIFGALWELGRRLGVGLYVDLKKIPVKQETIEVCEFFNLNPYELLSGGALLMAAENGGELVKSLEKAGVFAAVIGSTCGGNDRIVKNGEEIRYLGLPQPDEIFKVFF